MKRQLNERGLWPEKMHCSCSSSSCIWYCCSRSGGGAAAVAVHQHFCKLVSTVLLLLLRVRSPCALDALQSAVLLFLPHPPPPPPPLPPSPPPTTPTTTPAAVVQWWLLQSYCIPTYQSSTKSFLRINSIGTMEQMETEFQKLILKTWNIHCSTDHWSVLTWENRTEVKMMY